MASTALYTRNPMRSGSSLLNTHPPNCETAVACGDQEVVPSKGSCGQCGCRPNPDQPALVYKFLVNQRMGGSKEAVQALQS